MSISQVVQDSRADPFGSVDQTRVIGETVRTPLATQIITIARRRKWIIASAVVACLLAGIIVTLLMTPRYTATTTVEIQRESGGIADVDSSNGQRAAQFIDPEFYETQYGILKSKALALRVATDLRLYDNVNFLTQNKIGPDAWFSGGRLNPTASRRADRIEAVAGFLMGIVEVDPIKLSRLVEIRVTSRNAALSQQVANTWASDYIQVTLDRRYNATSYARRFLEQRLQQLRDRIDTSERRLVNYARQQGIVNLPVSANADGTSGPERSLAADDLASLNGQLAIATGDRIRAEARLHGDTLNSQEALQNTTLSTLRTRRAELNADYARLMTQFEPGYPPAQALKNQLDQLDRTITREEQRAGGSVSEVYRASVAREKALRARVNELKSAVLDARNRSIEYNIIQRDVDTSRQLYDALLQRYKSIGVAGGVGINNISVVDPAELPKGPSSPKVLINIAAALLLGVALGVLGAMIAEQLDQGIAEPEDVQNSLGLPLLGTIPKDASHAGSDGLRDRKSALSEAYISLQTSLSFATANGMPRTIAVTSTRSAEGKSTTSFALALMIARAKHSVVLVDMDMRSPSVHSWFEAKNGLGVSNYLSGGSQVDSLVHQSTTPALYFVTAGPTPPSSPELLSSDRLSTFMADLLGRFDYVVLDAPPVMGLADAPLIASKAEGTVFVLEAGTTQRKMAQVALNRLRATHAELTGIVLTKFDARRASFGYGYGYGYGYEYGTTTQQE